MEALAAGAIIAVAIIGWLLWRSRQQDIWPTEARDTAAASAELPKMRLPETLPRPTLLNEAPPRGDSALAAGSDLRLTFEVRTYTLPDGPDVDDDFESDYADFVRATWAAADIHTAPIQISINGTPATLHSLKRRLDGAPYVNLWWGPARSPKTFVADRHEWEHGGGPLHASAFQAMLAGVPAEQAVLPDPPPNDIDEAIAKDRFAAEGRRLVLRYRDRNGSESWRIISRMVRGADNLAARCHYRWGEKRQFRNDRILGLADPDTREEIDVQAYLAKRIDLPKPKRSRTVAKGQ